MSLLPMGISWVIILGLMAMFGVEFNIVTIILSTFTSNAYAQKASAYLEECIKNQDSSGGIIECVVTGMPVGIGVKGIMTAKAALKAQQAGAHAIIVSNHGGYKNCCTASACTAAYKRAYEYALSRIREWQKT